MKVAKTFWTILRAIINYSLFSCFIIGWLDLAFRLDIMFGTYMAAFFFLGGFSLYYAWCFGPGVLNSGAS